MLKVRLHAIKSIAFACVFIILASVALVTPAAAAPSDNINQESGWNSGASGDGTVAGMPYHGYEIEFEDKSDVTMQDAYDYAKKELNSWKYGIFCITAWAYCGPTALVSSIKDIFETDFLISGEVASLINYLSSAFLVTGRLLCCLYFLLALMDAATRDSFTVETFVKNSAKLVIIFVIFSPETIKAVTEFGASLGDWVIDLSLKGSAQAGFQKMKDYADSFKNISFFGAFGALFENLFPSFAMLLSMIVSFLVAFGRSIELAVYQSMLPLAMGSIFDGGLRSSGFRYIKKWLALYIQGGIMIVILIVAHELSLATAHATFFKLLKDVSLALAAASVVAKSKNIANDVMGV